jgi:hypothetical protein
MASEAAEAGASPGLPLPRLPERIPDLRRPWLNLFELVWFAALLLAIAGPAAGLWYRFTTPGENSALMLGSRAGLVLSDTDLTQVRFPVGSAARAAGVRPGDDIIAIDGIPVSRQVPLARTAAGHATDTDYALFAPLIESGEPIELDLTLRGTDGATRNYHVRTGEQHIEQAARGLGLPPAMLSVVDLLHVVTYPFLLFAAWILHRRKREDLISSVLSLAILLTIASEQPSAAFLTFVAHVPGWLHRLLYDLGNICLLAGILLFPFGQLRPRISILILALLPLLFFLSGDVYRATFMLFMAAGVLTLLWRLKNTPPSPARQQVKWALVGFSGYALFLALALGTDMTKLHVGSFASQLTLELMAGLSFGLAFLWLQLGLLIALMRYRLYDAEVVISRSANIALVTLAVTAVFAATADGLKQIILNYSGNNGSMTPVVFAAAIATVLVNPIQERIQRWSEKRFQRNLVMLRDELPECVRDMRETASLSELLEEVLQRVEKGVRAVRAAAIIETRVLNTRKVPLEEVEQWLSSSAGVSCREELCKSDDPLFPIRVPLVPGRDDDEPSLGLLLVGPRPDGSIPSKDEQRALVDVAEPIARAIRNVIKREARERRIAELIEANARRIETLEELLRGPGEMAGKGTRRPA